MDPRVRQRKMRTFLVSDLGRLTLGVDQGFDAYLRFFRERSVGERRDLTCRLGALFVSVHGPWRSRSSLPPLRRDIAPETFLG
jgi:hypothetical protein